MVAFERSLYDIEELEKMEVEKAVKSI